MKTYHEHRQALGSTIYMTLVSDAGDDAASDVLRRLWLEIFLFEKRCSRFLPNSELSQFNRAAGTKQHVTPEFREALLAAQRMSTLTDGLYNPFVLPSLQQAGYKHSLVAEYATDPVDDHSARQLVTAGNLEISDNWVSIPYGTAIDLGGCGKGYIGEVLADLAVGEPGVQGFWFSIGGDVVTYGFDELGNPWNVAVSPSIADTSVRVADIAMPDGDRYAVATSTTALRKGVAQGKAWHHIIDPRTGQPAETQVAMATVSTRSLLEADVLASCVIIVGDAAAESFIQAHNVRAALVAIDPATQPGTAAATAQALQSWQFRTYGASIRLAPGVTQSAVAGQDTTGGNL